jgi:hypothetical protein
LRIGLAVDAASHERAPVGRTSFLLNAREPAVNNDVALLIRERFEERRPQSTGVVVLDDLPANHDIIDPTNPEERVRSVYPELRTLVEAATYSGSSSPDPRSASR